MSMFVSVAVLINAPEICWRNRFERVNAFLTSLPKAHDTNHLFSTVRATLYSGHCRFSVITPLADPAAEQEQRR